MSISEAIFAVAVAATMFALYGWQRHWQRNKVQSLFDRLVFQTEAGLVPGAQMKVVKRIVDTVGSSDGGNGITGAYWYCVGPGPSYFVAIAQRTMTNLVRSELQWVVRPLSEDRMRGALVGDTEALFAAFGERIGDKLHA